MCGIVQSVVRVVNVAQVLLKSRHTSAILYRYRVEQFKV
jgi:hypothetical protein